MHTVRSVHTVRVMVRTCGMEGYGDDGVLEAEDISAHALSYVPHPHLTHTHTQTH